jgi:hypothetical protein
MRCRRGLCAYRSQAQFRGEGSLEVGVADRAACQGHRLTAAVALTAQGRRIVQLHPFTPNTHSIYPCKKPVARGYGVKSCP